MTPRRDRLRPLWLVAAGLMALGAALVALTAAPAGQAGLASPGLLAAPADANADAAQLSRAGAGDHQPQQAPR